jgi:hypothetical protein
VTASTLTITASRWFDTRRFQGAAASGKRAVRLADWEPFAFSLRALPRRVLMERADDAEGSVMPRRVYLLGLGLAFTDRALTLPLGPGEATIRRGRPGP